MRPRSSPPAAFPISWYAYIVIVLTAIHFPLLVARFTLFLAVEGPLIDCLILAGPASALLATVWALVRRRERANLMVCALCLMVHILGHLTLWLGAGRPRITLG